MPIRVIHMVQDLRVGGVERVIQTIVTGLDKSKFIPEVWAIHSGGFIAEQLKTAGIPVTILSVKNCYSPAGIWKAAGLLRRSKTLIVHTHGYFADTFGRAAAILAGVPIRIVHYHSIFHNLSWINVAIHRILNRSTQGIIAISQSVRDSFADHKRNPKKVTIIFNGIDPGPYKADQQCKTQAAIIIVASLTPHKGHRFLIAAFKTLAQDFPQTQLWIVGDGPLKKELEAQAKSAGIGGQIRFYGQVDTVPELFCQATIAALCSLREGMPLSILEAMAAGLPVVAPRIGGIPEVIIDNTTGILFNPGDSAAIASSLIRLLKDPETARAMGEAGRERFKKYFTSTRMVHQIEELYEWLLAGKKQHP